MYSKEQTDAAADALLEAAKARRKPNPIQKRMFPELKDLSVDHRYAALKTAREAARRSRPVLTVGAGIAILALSLAANEWTGSEHASPLMWSMMGLALLLPCVHKRETHKRLRRMSRHGSVSQQGV